MPRSVKGVMREWKTGQLHSGSPNGPVVKNQKQPVAIALELMGNSPYDARASAHAHEYNSYPCDWRQCVRAEAKADKLALQWQGLQFISVFQNI